MAAATMDERMDVMRYLLDHGADPNKQHDSFFTALHCAAKKGLFSAHAKLSAYRLVFTEWLLCEEERFEGVFHTVKFCLCFRR